MQLSTKVNNFRHPFDTTKPVWKDLPPPKKKNRNLRLSVRFLLRFKSSYSSPVTHLWPLSCRVLKGGVQGEVAVTGQRVAIFVLLDPLIVVLPTRRVPTIDVVEFTKSCIIDTNDAFIRHPIGREESTICLEDSATMLHHQFQVECDIHRLPSSRSHKLSHIGAPWWHSNEVVVGSATRFRPSPRNQTCLQDFVNAPIIKFCSSAAKIPKKISKLLIGDLLKMTFDDVPPKKRELSLTI